MMIRMVKNTQTVQSENSFEEGCNYNPASPTQLCKTLISGQLRLGQEVPLLCLLPHPCLIC